MSASELLPGNGTPWERALANTMSDEPAIGTSINRISSAKLYQPPPSFVPFLIAEYGLGELTAYVEDQYRLLGEGVTWQRVRGTPSALAMALAWVGHAGILMEASTARRFWNSFQLVLETLPLRDDPDLSRIDRVAHLSVPIRSKLRRVVHRHDVPMMVLDQCRLDRAMLDTDSGTTIAGSDVRWSFGRASEFEHVLTEAEGLAIGNWLDPPAEEDPESSLRWDDLEGVTWADAAFPWDSSAAFQRRALLSNWFRSASAFVRFADADGGVIGYRRCRSLHPVVVSAAGPLSFGAQRFAPSANSQMVYFEAMTAFQDVIAEDCTSVALVISGTPASGVKPGKQWLTPDEMQGGQAIAEKAVAFTMRRTVRERIKFLMKF